MENKLAWGNLLAQTYRLYRERFWTLFRMALLPAALAYGWRYFYRLVYKQLWDAGWVGYKSPGQLALFLAAVWTIGAVYWAISGFFFAAVAAHVLPGTNDATPALADAFTRSRARIGPVMSVALLCWTGFWLGREASGLAVFAIMDRLSPRPGSIVAMLLLSIPVLILAGLLSRLGLAIPALMNESEISLRTALRVSLKKTENWEFFFIMFLAKSAMLGYAAYWLGGRGFDWLWQHGVLNRTTYAWASQAFYIGLFAALESPLFIAFSLLYRHSARNRTLLAPVSDS